MTRKDFVVIADILIQHQTTATPQDMNSLIAAARTTLAKHYPNFDPIKFETYIRKFA